MYSELIGRPYVAFLVGFAGVCAVSWLSWFSGLSTVAMLFLSTCYGIAAALFYALTRLQINAGLTLAIPVFFPLFAFAITGGDVTRMALWIIPAVLIPFAATAFLRQPAACLNRAFRAWGWILLLLWAGFTTLWSPNPIYGVDKVLRLAVLGIGPGVVALLVWRQEDRRTQWEAFLITAIAFCIFVLLRGQELALYPGRLTLEGGNPIPIARAALLGVTVALWADKVPLWTRGIAAVLGLAVAWQTGSRGPLLAFVLANVFGLAVRFLRSCVRGQTTVRWTTAIVLPVVVSGMVLAGIWLGNGRITLGRFDTLRSPQVLMNDPNVVARLAAFAKSLSLFLQKPLLGVGLGGYAPVGERAYPHNLPVEILAEMGLVGGIIWSIALLQAWRRCSRSLLLRVILLQAFLYSLVSADLGQNFEYVLFSVQSGGLSVAATTTPVGTADRRGSSAVCGKRRSAL